MSELTVDFWLTLSVVPMLVALGIYVWLSRRFERALQRDALHYEESVQAVQAPLDMSVQAAGPHLPADSPR